MIIINSVFPKAVSHIILNNDSITAIRQKANVVFSFQLKEVRHRKKSIIIPTVRVWPAWCIVCTKICSYHCIKHYDERNCHH